MARTTKNTNAPAKADTTNAAVFVIRGTIAGVYEGKNRNYLTVRVNGTEINPKSGEPYYNMIKVSCEKEIELFDDNTLIDVEGKITTYFDRDKQSTNIILTAEKLTPVNS